MLANFDREKESRLWFPVLMQNGFTNLRLTSETDDLENVMDAIGHQATTGDVNFALRSRNDKGILQYKKEFTIGYRRPSGQPVEWQKLFEKNLPKSPDYFAYGWVQDDSIKDYVILAVSVLKQLYNAGYLTPYADKFKQSTNEFVFIPISIPELLDLPEAIGLIAFHSENHPALPKESVVNIGEMKMKALIDERILSHLNKLEAHFDEQFKAINSLLVELTSCTLRSIRNMESK